MFKTVLAGFTLAVSACTWMPRPMLATQDDAVRVAKAEVIKRGLSLPPNYTTSVQVSRADFEFRESYPVYVVTIFSTKPRRAVYEVTVNARSGDLEVFTDWRRTIPAER